MKKIKNFTLISLTVLLSTTKLLIGQETDDAVPEPTFNFSGSVDTYFRSSFSEDPVAPGTSFANLNGFALGMANFIVSYEGERSWVMIEI